MKVRLTWLTVVLAVGLLPGLAAAADLTPQLEQLGKELYFDKMLSSPPGQACADCHAPFVGFTGPIPGINKKGAVYPGAVHQRTGNRKPPTAAYASTAPLFDFDTLVGGNFWDGRATGWNLGNPAADQAIGPFLNPVEQNNPDLETVVIKVCRSTYGDLFRDLYFQVYEGADACDPPNAAHAYDFIGKTIAVFEDSAEVNQFSSKYDAYLQACIAAGNPDDVCASAGGGWGDQAALDVAGVFSPMEWLGFQLYVLPNDNDGTLADGEGGNCAACHVLDFVATPTAVSQVFPELYTDVESYTPNPLFTDYTYDNLGVPKNPANPFYEMDQVYISVDGELKPINPDGADWIDPGLAGFLCSGDPTACPDEYGMHKVPTLRNVAKRPGKGFAKAYMHNGVFKSLEEVVDFYNTRDVAPWPPAEVPGPTVNTAELGNLGLDPSQVKAIVKFMEALSDGYF